MKVTFITNEGGGFAGDVDISPGTTIQAFLQDQMDRSPDNCVISVNSEPVPADLVLKDGDRVSVTPVNIKGA